MVAPGKFFLAFYHLLASSAAAAAGAVTIKTGQGEIAGAARTARNGDGYTAFLGVPFAVPPVGELRWRPPVAAGAWEGVRDGTVDAEECWQNQMDNPAINVGSEDCLYVNVFTKHPGDEEAKRPGAINCVA